MRQSQDSRNKTTKMEEKEEVNTTPSECQHLITYVDEDNFIRCQTCDEIVDA